MIGMQLSMRFDPRHWLCCGGKTFRSLRSNHFGCYFSSQGQCSRGARFFLRKVKPTASVDEVRLYAQDPYQIIGEALVQERRSGLCQNTNILNPLSDDWNLLID